MQSTSLTAQSEVSLTPSEAFGMFGTSHGAGWLFDARCESVVVGVAVSLRLPVDHGAGKFGVELLGRISKIRRTTPISISIVHTQPWQGTITLTFNQIRVGLTRIRVRADVSAEGVEWLIRRRGIVLPTPPPAEGTLRIGLLTSKSGPGAVYAMANEHLADLAVEEVNENGGVGGRALELMVADDATDPALASTEARRLVRSGCRAVFASTTSSSFAAVKSAIGESEVLLVYATINEGGTFAPTVLRFGERPGAQVRALADPMMRQAGGRNWFLVGQEYSWSYGAHFAARAGLAGAGGRVVGESCTPLGTTDFSSIIRQIRLSGADIVMSSLVGSDEVEFQRQCFAAGVRAKALSLSLVMEESTAEHIGASASEGIWTAMSYFQDGPLAGNRDLLSRYHDTYGMFAPPISTHGESVYESILQYARAVNGSPDDSASQHALALLQHRGSGGIGAIGTRDLLAQKMYLAEVRGGALHVVDEAR